MATRSITQSVPRISGSSVLSSWKEIGQYLGKSVRTVERWEREFGLPVRRAGTGSSKSPVIAVPAEIDAWVQARPMPIGEDGSRKSELVQLRKLVAELRAQVAELRREV